MDTKTRKICNDYYIFARDKQEKISSPLVLTRRARKCSWFLSLGTSDQYNFELSMEKIFELPVSNVWKHDGELWTAMKYNTEKVYKFFMLHELAVFTLCHARAKNPPRLSMHGYWFVFSPQGCTRFWLLACEPDDFLYYNTLNLLFPDWPKAYSEFPKFVPVTS